MSTNTALLNGGMDVKQVNGGPYYVPTNVEDTKEAGSPDRKRCCDCTCLQTVSNYIVSGLERSFYR